MKTVIQRVSRASVKVNCSVISSIDRGILALVGFTHNDSEDELIWTAHKLAGLRIFEDNNCKMNLSLKDTAGKVMVVSQFTLYADVRKGRRPAFVDAAEPNRAKFLYERFCDLLEAEDIIVERGEFGARMEVELVNDGPVTIIIER
ncbi:MAG: D-aminoacyl-tRNA deacylase [Candidatus Hatepunaea meridiana]|nr:D-aminoacyl-tRNA deacylase [Candidatus Hatepunaea meridiana]